MACVEMNKGAASDTTPWLLPSKHDIIKRTCMLRIGGVLRQMVAKRMSKQRTEPQLVNIDDFDALLPGLANGSSIQVTGFIRSAVIYASKGCLAKTRKVARPKHVATPMFLTMYVPTHVPHCHLCSKLFPALSELNFDAESLLFVWNCRKGSRHGERCH